MEEMINKARTGPVPGERLFGARTPRGGACGGLEPRWQAIGFGGRPGSRQGLGLKRCEGIVFATDSAGGRFASTVILPRNFSTALTAVPSSALAVNGFNSMAAKGVIHAVVQVITEFAAPDGLADNLRHGGRGGGKPPPTMRRLSG